VRIFKCPRCLCRPSKCLWMHSNHIHWKNASFRTRPNSKSYIAFIVVVDVIILKRKCHNDFNIVLIYINHLFLIKEMFEWARTNLLNKHPRFVCSGVHYKKGKHYVFLTHVGLPLLSADEYFPFKMSRLKHYAQLWTSKSRPCFYSQQFLWAAATTGTPMTRFAFPP
jgi:hypothetical protein